ncbi:MAG: EAL domain-containing protein [Proteobacteria bacterium]|nr:EAL domain-containing protein [Pseudomonadota bacterium]
MLDRPIAPAPSSVAATQDFVEPAEPTAGPPHPFPHQQPQITHMFAKSLQREELIALRRALNQTAIVAATDRAGRITHANPRFCEISGYTEGELVGQDHRILNSGHHPREFFQDLWRTITRGETWHGEVRNRSKSGTLYWVETTIAPLLSRTGVLQGYVSIRFDITARKQAELELATENVFRQQAENLLRQIVDTIPAGISAFDADDRLLIYNDAFKAFYPKVADLIQEGVRFDEILKAAAERGQFAELAGQTRDIEAWLARRLREHAKPTQSLVQKLDDGRWVQIRERRTYNGLHVAIRADITDLKLAEQTIRRQAEQDALTGLANRAAVYGRVERLLADKAPQGLLVVTDLDNFKAVNDTLGHDAGDELLVVVGRRLAGAVRKTDMIARMGGDEFAIVMGGITSRQVAERRLSKIASFVQQPVALTGRTVQPRISMGVVLIGSQTGNRKDLFREADLALYQAKAAGRGRYTFFDEAMLRAAERRQSDIEELRTGLQRDELRVEFQPQVNLASGEPMGLEALARWQRGSEVISPASFIPLAEESGLIIPLGSRVIELSLAFQASMRARGLRSGRLAINVAAAQLKLDDFVETLANQLSRFGLKPADIEIEITETVLLDRSVHQIARTIEKLDSLGVTIALDDFGTGYASLSHLKQFKVDRLKIDRSFVADIRPEDGRGVIARTIVSLAHSLGMDVVGEGIETQFQSDALKAIGCDIGQGYLLSPPLSPDNTEQYFQQRTLAQPHPSMRIVA